MRSTQLTVVQGTPFSVLVRVKRRNEQGELVPYELTGCTIKLQAREKISSSAPFLTLGTDVGGITVDAAAGTFTMALNSTQTRILAASVVTNGVYHCEVQPSNGENFRVLSGSIKFDRAVIR